MTEPRQTAPEPGAATTLGPPASPAPGPVLESQVAIPSPYGYAGPPASGMSGLARSVGGFLDRLSASIAAAVPQLDRDTIRPASKVVIWLIIQVGGIWLLGTIMGGGDQPQGAAPDAIGTLLGTGR